MMIVSSGSIEYSPVAVSYVTVLMLVHTDLPGQCGQTNTVCAMSSNLTLSNSKCIGMFVRGGQMAAGASLGINPSCFVFCNGVTLNDRRDDTGPGLMV